MQQTPGGGQSNNPQSAHTAMMNYRINALEQAVKALGAQLQSYVPRAENDLILRGIRDAMERIEKKLNEMEKASTDQREALEKKIVEQEKKIVEQGNSQDKLQIRVLWGIVSTGIFILTSVLVAFLTHHIV